MANKTYIRYELHKSKDGRWFRQLWVLEDDLGKALEALRQRWELLEKANRGLEWILPKDFFTRHPMRVVRCTVEVLEGVTL